MEVFISMSMGAKLKQSRMGIGYSLQQVADAIGVSKAHIYELELNKVKNPSVKTLRKLAELYDKPLSYYLDEKEDVKFKVMFRDLEKNFAELGEEDRKAVEIMIQALKSRKADD